MAAIAPGVGIFERSALRCFRRSFSRCLECWGSILIRMRRSITSLDSRRVVTITEVGITSSAILDETGDFPPIHFGTGFTTWMSQAAAPRLPSLKGLPVVELAFSCETVPWLLDEPDGD